MKAYQAENGARVKLPRLLPSEAETVRNEMARREAADVAHAPFVLLVD